MKKKFINYCLLVLITFMIMSRHENVFGQDPQVAKSGAKIADEVTLHDVKMFDPKANGLRDLVFELRMDNLTEILKSNYPFGKLTEVYYKIFWFNDEANGENWQIDIYGLPNGYEEIKADLRKLVMHKMEFIIPKKLTSLVDGLVYEPVSIGQKKYLKFIDPTMSKITSDLLLAFDGSGKLTEYLTKNNERQLKMTFDYISMPTFNGKFAVKRHSVLNEGPKNSSTVTHSLEYGPFGTFHMPVKITIQTQNKFTVVNVKNGKAEKEKTQTQDLSSVLRLSKYEINTGKGKNKILHGK